MGSKVTYTITRGNSEGFIRLEVSDYETATELFKLGVADIETTKDSNGLPISYISMGNSVSTFKNFFRTKAAMEFTGVV